MINLTSYSGLGAAPLPRTIRRARSRDARGFRGYLGLSLLLQNVADQESADKGRDPLPRELRARFHLTEGEGEEAAPMRRGGSVEERDEFLILLDTTGSLILSSKDPSAAWPELESRINLGS